MPQSPQQSIYDGFRALVNGLPMVRYTNAAANMGDKIMQLLHLAPTPAQPVPPPAPDTSWHDQMVRDANASFLPQAAAPKSVLALRKPQK